MRSLCCSTSYEPILIEFVSRVDRRFLPSPIKIIAWSVGVDQRLFALPFAFMLASLIAGQFADIVYFSVRIFFSSIISIFFNKVSRMLECCYV